MTPADKSVAYATSCEMVKYALRQTKDGIVVSFVVHPNDIPAALQISHIGSRWMAALVQIGDDEQPVQLPSIPKVVDAMPQPERPRQAGAKRDWCELSPAQQAGIRCDERSFEAFLKEERPDDWHESRDAAACVRLICGVSSRAYIEKDQRSRVLWKQLDDQYGAWKALEHA